MCFNLKILNRTNNGMLMFCPKNNFFQLSFNNLMFNLNSTELYALTSYLDNLEIDFWESEYKNSIYDRKIPIPTLQANLVILLNKSEVFEMHNLLDCTREEKILRCYEIDYQLCYN